MKRIIPVALLLIVAAFAPGWANAQSQPPDSAQTTPQPAATPQFLSVTVVTVKPDMNTDYQNFVKTETNPGLRKGGVKWRDVWQQTAAAGNPFEYIIVTPIDNYAQYDGPGPMEKALGKEGFAAWQSKAGRFIESVHRYVIRMRPELSYQTKMTGPPKLAVITHNFIAPGHTQEFENYIKNDYLPVVKQGKDVAYLVAQTVFGGDANEYITLTLRETFADIDKGPTAVQVLGAEGALKLLQKIPAGTVARTERSMIRYVPELSLLPAETATK